MADLSEIRQEVEKRHVTAAIERYRVSLQQSVQQDKRERLEADLNFIERQLSDLSAGDSLRSVLESKRDELQNELLAMPMPFNIADRDYEVGELIGQVPALQSTSGDIDRQALYNAAELRFRDREWAKGKKAAWCRRHGFEPRELGKWLNKTERTDTRALYYPDPSPKAELIVKALRG